MTSQAFSASANVLKGDPPTLTAGLLKLMGRQEATKPGFPWSPGPLRLSLLITNEKPRSLALHISSACVAGAMRLKCMGAFHDPASLSGPRFSGWGRQPVGRFSSGQGALGHRPEAGIRRWVERKVPEIGPQAIESQYLAACHLVHVREMSAREIEILFRRLRLYDQLGVSPRASTEPFREY